jgi:hypothetical protein
VQVKRLVAGPAELANPVPGAAAGPTASGAAVPGEREDLPPPGSAPTGAGPAGAGPAAGDPVPRTAGETGPGRPPDVSALLDEAFGEEP